MTEELKPCPFCGGAPEITTRDVEPQGDPWYGGKTETFVLCGCGACLFDGHFHEGFYDPETRAVEAWNRRALLAAGASEGQAEPVAWVRYRSDGGFEGPIMDTDERMCDTRRKSGAWTPLYAAPNSSGNGARSVAEWGTPAYWQKKLANQSREAPAGLTEREQFIWNLGHSAAQDDALDAARYRWLRNEHFPTADNPPLAQVVWKFGSNRRGSEWANLIDGNDLDAAIDRAMQDKEGS